MDAVKLAVPAVVAVSKLIGSEGGFGGAGVKVKEVESVRDSVRLSTVASPLIDRCSSLVSHKDATTAVNASELTSWGNLPQTECVRRASEVHNFQHEDVPEQLKCRGSDSSVVFKCRNDSVQLQRKSGKVSRSGSGCSKRPRIAQMEDLSSPGGHNDVNGIADTLGFYPTKYAPPEKAQVIKQKINLNGKRGDKRNFKVPLKTKYDSFSLKAGLPSFTSAAGGNNILGLYGLKSDNHDVTKHVDELSLNELLDGSYKSPSLGKDKAKGASNASENFLHSIKKACSVLELRRPVKSQIFSETDSSSGWKISASALSSASCVASSTGSDKEDTNITDLSVHNKDSSNKPEVLPIVPDFSLLQPKDVLGRLTLPPPKDLESLLLDAAKPAIMSRNSFDPRSGKPTTNRACLPPFPWSHTLGGHCKTNSDSAKISSSRTTCQGRWTRIENTADLLGVVSDSFTDLKSFTYDRNLVPSEELNFGRSENGIAPSISVSLPQYEVGPSSSGTCSEGFRLPTENADSGGNLKHELIAEHSPRLLAAAQTLVDLVSHSLRHDPCGMTKWPNRHSQKAMKACKLKLIEKAEEFCAAPKLGMAYDNLVKSVDQIIPSKKPKLSMTEKKKDLAHAHADIKGPINWSAPKSCRSSPSRSARDSSAEAKPHNANTVKQSCMLPPAARVFEKACNSQQKPRKIGPMDWNRARDKQD